VVIHQPSSDIYKMFDKVFLLDTGGYPIYYGNPVEAIIYFKKATNQVGGDKGQCMTCGNVTPEQLFNIVEARVVDEYGEFTNKRKASPNDWFSLHKESFKVERVEESKDSPPKNLKIPSKLKQMLIFSTRDFLSKISNTQYMLINLLEAPVLAFMLAFIIRYKEGYDTEYVFRHNDNMPAYILMAVIVALFMGLTVSAEEIIRDRKILRRESFLNLSRMSYIVSKVLILFSLSAIQTLCFSVLGNWIVGVEGLTMSYWAILFTVSCFANILGLNISSAFNSAVTVYILIPLLIIPQLILSGAIFNFDKLNSFISQQGKVPVIADLIASRWAYEGLIVQQFRNNSYQRPLFEKEAIASQNHFRSVYWIPKIEELLINAKTLMGDSSDSSKIKMEYYL
jgi:ABC transport system ATP-binding/permease protein